MRPSALALAFCLIPSTGLADGLLDRQVQFNVVTLRDTDWPEERSADYIATVGKGAEFTLGPEGIGGLNIVPVDIDVSDRAIHFNYSANAPGRFMGGQFNGYVLTFLTDCVLIEGATIIPSQTTFPLTDDDLTISPGALAINMAGLAFDAEDRLAIAVDVGDCPLS